MVFFSFSSRISSFDRHRWIFFSFGQIEFSHSLNWDIWINFWHVWLALLASLRPRHSLKRFNHSDDVSSVLIWTEIFLNFQPSVWFQTTIDDMWIDGCIFPLVTICSRHRDIQIKCQRRKFDIFPPNAHTNHHYNHTRNLLAEIIVKWLGLWRYSSITFIFLHERSR